MGILLIYKSMNYDVNVVATRPTIQRRSRTSENAHHNAGNSMCLAFLQRAAARLLLRDIGEFEPVLSRTAL